LTKGKRHKVVRFLISPKKKKVKIEVNKIMNPAFFIQEIKRHKERKEKKNKKCGDWCEDPVKREKERCSGSY